MPGKRPMAWVLGGARPRHLPRLADLVLLPGPHRGGALRPGLSCRPDVDCRAACRRATPRSSDNCQACHVEPFVPVRDAACKACHTAVHDHADPRRLQRARRPHLGGFRRLQHDDRRAGSARTRAAASIAIPSMRARSACRRRRSNSAPTAMAICARACPTRGSPTPPISRRGHPEFQPLVLVRWDGEQPQLRAGRARPAAARDEQPQIPARAASRSARRRGADGPAAARPLRLRRRARMRRLPRADARRHPLPAGRHGERLRHVPQPRLRRDRRHHPHPAPRLAGAGDRRSARALPRRRAAAPARAQRRRPRLARRRRPDPRRRPVSPAPAPASAAAPIRRSARVFSQGGACFDCHEVVQPPPGTLNYGIRPVAFPTRYLLHGWFDHRDHQIMQRPGQPRLEGAAACASCHGAPASNSAAATCCCPTSPAAATAMAASVAALPVASTCAMCHDYHMDGGTPAMLLQAARPRPALGNDRDPDRPAAAARAGGSAMLVAQITDLHLGFDPGIPDELNRQRLDRTLRAPRRDEPAAGPAARHRRHRRQWRRRASPTSAFREAIAGLPFPVHPAMGNHDSRARLPRRLPRHAGAGRLCPICDRGFAGPHPRPRHARDRPPRRRLLRDARRLADGAARRGAGAADPDRPPPSADRHRPLAG